MDSKMMTFDQAAQYGFVFPGARMWVSPETLGQCAQDAALVTTPNMGIPVEFTSYFDPEVIQILTAPTNARQIFGEEKKGDWTTSFAKFRVTEMVGRTEPYSDYSHAVTSDVNNEWMDREQYLFQTTITYGQRETALSSAAKLNLAAEKQAAAATRIEIDSNRFYLLGVEGKQVYGILNDPSLPAAITAAAGSNGTAWSSKTTKEIYDDILALHAQLAKQSKGLITHTSQLKLCMSPTMAVYMGSATDFNVTVRKMLDGFFPNLEIVTLPELESDDGDQTVFMIAPKVAGRKSAALAFTEKMRSFPAVPDLSSWAQKFSAGTYGGVVYMPLAFASMTGVA